MTHDTERPRRQPEDVLADAIQLQIDRWILRADVEHDGGVGAPSLADFAAERRTGARPGELDAQTHEVFRFLHRETVLDRMRGWSKPLERKRAPLGISREVWATADYEERGLLLLRHVRGSLRQPPRDVCYHVLACEETMVGALEERAALLAQGVRPEVVGDMLEHRWVGACPRHTFGDVAEALLGLAASRL